MKGRATPLLTPQTQAGGCPPLPHGMRLSQGIVQPQMGIWGGKTGCWVFWGKHLQFFCRNGGHSRATVGCKGPARLGWDRKVAAAGTQKWGRMSANIVIAAPDIISIISLLPSSPPKGQAFVPLPRVALHCCLHSSYTSPSPPNFSQGHAIPPAAHFSSDLGHCCAKHPTRFGPIWNWSVPRCAICQ